MTAEVRTEAVSQQQDHKWSMSNMTKIRKKLTEVTQIREWATFEDIKCPPPAGVP